MTSHETFTSSANSSTPGATAASALSAPSDSVMSARAVRRVRLHAVTRDAVIVLAGVAVITLVGQLKFPLPFSPVPVTLGTFAVLTVGMFSGPRLAFVSSTLFALLAAIGAPVLAGWSHGFGPTYGYVLGYIPAAVVAGYAAAAWRGKGSLVRRIVVTAALYIAALAVVYVPGLIWLHAAINASWATTFSLGFLPFILGAIVKAIVASGITPVVPLLARR